jgi:hypothetical protein
MLDEYKKNIRTYFRDKHEVLCVYIFGSAAAGKETPYSDIDVAILFDDSVSPLEYSDRQIALSIELGRLLNREIDVIILNRAAPYLKFQIIKEGAIVYESPARSGRPFEARAVLEYFDFLPVKNMLESAMMRKVKGA